MLEGILASTEHLTVGTLELNPGEAAAAHAHGGDEVCYVLEGALQVRALARAAAQRVRARAATTPATCRSACAHEYRNYGSGLVRALFGVAPSYLP